MSSSNPSVFQEFWVSDKLMHKSGEGVIRCSVEKLFSHSTETFCGGTLLCFKKTLVSKILTHCRGASRWCRKDSGERSHVSESFGYGTFFLHKNGIALSSFEAFFVSQCQQIWKNPSISQKSSGIESFFAKQGEQLFSVDFFCLTVPKNFVGEAFCVSENFCYRKFSCMGEGGGHHGIVQKKVCLTGG